MFPNWAIGPFTKLDDENPILSGGEASEWFCPLNGSIAWEAKDVFNPAAVVKDGAVHLLYRAEDAIGPCLGTSRIGLARSSDGIHFTRESVPVFYPDDDDMRRYEWPGGTEDPRICSTEDGRFVMTYTAYDGKKARLCVATSEDLFKWQKHGLAFKSMPFLWSKAGSIVCKVKGDQLIATRVKGKYWMYWGESYIFAATSNDLIEWEPVTHPGDSPLPSQEGMPRSQSYSPWWTTDDIGFTMNEREALVSIIRPRLGRFDSVLVEPGPPAVITDRGIVLLYHGKNEVRGGDPNFPAHTYCVGQVLLDLEDPTAVLSRVAEPFLFPEKPYEVSGQVGNVCFAEGLVPFGDRWLLYYGTADSRVAVATASRII